MYICAAVGSFGFASIVTKWPRNKIRIALGTIMIPLAAIMLCKNLGVGPFGIVGTATGLSGWKLIVAAALNILWGALMDQLEKISSSKLHICHPDEGGKPAGIYRYAR